MQWFGLLAVAAVAFLAMFRVLADRRVRCQSSLSATAFGVTFIFGS